MKSMTHFLKITLSVLGLILFKSTFISGQEIMKIKHSCNFSEEENEAEHYIFEASNEATKIVNTLLKASGLSVDGFILKESNCKNALATSEGRKRYILYNPVFLQKFKIDAKSKWVGYCVLAHEIAHHLNNHDLETDDPKIRKTQELEADKFAGHWLAKMGATLEEAQAGIHALPLENETSTHPPKSARLVAVTNGWTKAKETGSTNTNAHISEPINNTGSNQSGRLPKEITVPSGYLKCGECIGHGFHEATRNCFTCGGDGLITKKLSCSNCKGTTKVQVNCTDCDGKGHTIDSFSLLKSKSPCIFCHETGKKSVKCSVCEGEGYTYDFSSNEKCGSCDGEGRVDTQLKCKRCKGKGYIKSN